jgi:membrane associated rhomboid family serine protease
MRGTKGTHASCLIKQEAQTMFNSIPPITRILLLVNVAVFALQVLGANTSLILLFALWPASTPAHEGIGGTFLPWQLVTYSVLHGGPLHLFLNMFALHMFGSQLERLFGSSRYLILYLASVLVAGITQLTWSFVVGASPYPTIGASGGVFGLLLAYAMYFPRRMIVLIFPPIPLPAWLFVTLYVALELYHGISATEAGVAHFAHLGGMLGAFLVVRNWRGRRL